MNQNKVVLITGTSSGLGLWTSVRAAQAGFTVVATMRDPAKGEGALRDEVAKAGVSIDVDTLDVQAAGSINECVGRTLKKYGHIDILVNNAGFGTSNFLEIIEEEHMRNVFDVNMFGVMRCIKAVLPSMRERRSGRIITVSSVTGLAGLPTHEVYSASKFAVEGLMEGLATYLKPYFNIDCSLVEPADIHTNFTQRIIDDMAASAGIGEKITLASITPEFMSKVLGDKFDDYGPVFHDYFQSFQGKDGLLANAQTADEVAAVVVGAMMDPNPKMRYQSSAFARAFCAEKLASDPDGEKQLARIRKIGLGK